MSAECGCKIVIEKTPVALGFDAKRKIVYCPLHAAAGEMLEALRNARPIISDIVEEDISLTYTSIGSDALLRIDKAIAKAGAQQAEGGER